MHQVKVRDGSRLAAILGALEVDVNSFHHQAIHRLGRGLKDVAWAPDSKTLAYTSSDHTRHAQDIKLMVGRVQGLARQWRSVCRRLA